MLIIERANYLIQFTSQTQASTEQMQLLNRLIVAVFLLSTATQLSQPKSVSPNYKFTTSGVQSIDTTNIFGNASASISNLNYTIQAPVTLNSNSFTVVLGLSDVYADLSSGRLEFNFYSSQITSTGFQLSFSSNLTNYIKVLRIRYILIAQRYMYYTLTPAYYIPMAANLSSANSPLTYSINLTSDVNFTGSHELFISLTGFDLTTTTPDRVLDISISGTLVWPTYLYIYIRSKSTIPLFVKTLYFNCFIYNKPYLSQVSGQFSVYTIQTQSSTFTVTNTSFLYFNSTMVGLKSISIRGDTMIDFKTQFGSANSFTFSTSNQNPTYELNYMTLLTFACSHITPYQLNSTCYDNCPPYNFAILHNLSCLNCYTNCFSCNDIYNCSACSETQDHRSLTLTSPPNSTLKCLPMTGYYSATGTVCPKCAYDCYTCQNGSSCLTCNSLAHRVLNSSSQRCVPIFGYYESNKTNAQICRFDCQSCQNSNECLSCSSQSFRVKNTTSLGCEPKVGYYESNKAAAQKCRFDCQSCSNNNSCLSCNESNHRQLNPSDSRCIPMKGFYESNEPNCLACPKNCISCRSEAQCKECQSGYFLNFKNTCQICAPGCASCVSNQTCQGSNSIIIYIGVAVGVIVILGLGVIAYRCCKKEPPIEAIYNPEIQQQQDPRDSQIYPKPIYQYVRASQLQTLQSSQQLIESEGRTEKELEVWQERDKQIIVTQTCCICTDQMTFLKLCCNHYFHIECLVKWGQKNKHNRCPLCREDMTRQNHRIFCKLCRVKQKEISYKDLLKAYRQNSHKSEVVCEACQKIKT